MNRIHDDCHWRVSLFLCTPKLLFCTRNSPMMTAARVKISVRQVKRDLSQLARLFGGVLEPVEGLLDSL